MRWQYFQLLATHSLTLTLTSYCYESTDAHHRNNYKPIFLITQLELHNSRDLVIVLQIDYESNHGTVEICLNW